MSGLLGRLSGGKGSFATDSRAVSNLVGFILLFSILLLALAGWQAQVVPQETAQSEFQHHQTVQDDLIDFRNAIFETATASGSGFGSGGTATSITLGTTHPSRTLTIGPPSSAGSLRTSESYDVTVRNTRTNRTEQVPTRHVKYEPEYLEYRVGPIWYENSMLYLDEREQGVDEPIVLADQQLAVDGRTVRVIPTQNEISENGIEATSIEKYAAEAVEQNPELYEADTRRMQIIVPTRLDGDEYWDSELDGAVQYNITDSEDIPELDVNLLELLVEPDIEINTVGFQGGPTENPQRSPNDAEREFSDSSSSAPDNDELENIVDNMSGEGTESDPYVITDDQELQAINATDSSLDADYILGTNIDARETEQWNDGGFEPIGNDSDRFTGTIDGDGYIIYGLTIDRDKDGVGLFGFTEGATIQNIGIEKADIHTDVGRYIGGVAGSVENSHIENAYVTGEIDGDRFVGGLIGDLSGSDVERSYTRGTVTGDQWVGGLVGRDGFSGDGSHILNSHSTATVDLAVDHGGGLVGLTGTDATIENSYATGAVDGGSKIGGLVGHTVGSENVTNTYATGAVDGDDWVGGLVGHNFDHDIINSYATGAVDGDNYVGGLAGENGDNEGNIDDSYWDRGTTNQPDAVGVGDEGGSDGFGDTDDATPVSNMTGEAAKGNMTFVFADDWQSPGDWRTLEHPDDYPMLHRQAD